MAAKPLVTIVTPVLNGERFLRPAIESVLAQQYPHIDYWVFDAGSTDGTPAILSEYASRLRFRIAPDRGTADALNQAFRAARGEWCAWLSADDVYLPGAIAAAVDAIQQQPLAGVVFGGARWIDENGSTIGRYPVPATCSLEELARECVLCQPACFVRRDALAEVGFLDAALQSAFDYDLWVRLARHYSFARGEGDWALSRMHRANKSLGQRETMFAESMAVLERHFGYVPVRWIYGHLAFREQRTDQFFAPLRSSPATYLRALTMGLTRNPRQRARYFREWAGAPWLAMARKLARLRSRRPFL